MDNFEEMNVKAILTDTIKKQIKDGTLKIDRLQLRDSRGRFTTPLNTLIVKEDLKYSPALMVQFQNEFLVTLSVINRGIRAGFREQSEKLCRIERKLDQMIKNDMDRLNADVNFFFSEVADLDKHDSERAKQLLVNGGKTAALLAQKLYQFMGEYVDGMTCRHSRNVDYAVTYGEFKCGEVDKDKFYWRSKGIVEYPRFKGSSAEVYTNAFLEMLNSLNILSVIHRGRNMPDYLTNLEGVKNELVTLLETLAVYDLQKKFVGGYPGFRDMCYQLCPDYNDGKRPKCRGNPETERLRVYFSEFLSDELAVRERIVGDYPVLQDENLHCAITEILNMLESIDNLKMRASALPDTTEEREQAISALSDKFFLAHYGSDSAVPDPA
ncbi:hypothetical protein WCT78_00115 [Pectobacterium versatile]|uniref:hypothetical protein n=1 Tax=Pectobacterium TaxID=122277 RepID=UPI0018DF0B8B|nr:MULTISPECIES: hypothetical protein [Pectobacterium]MBI0472748.1 hypothetical protein [Pectobacterium parmentieri]MBI0495371.1 hypothetical protein [Pectobacterium parmentieri]MBI0569901.1 hypothetical protein [Pectobacterium parmentieri]MBI0574618.1 hypothetical protein [Pectobacterium parmentieri]MCQ8232899.1 hypothetical protein [Pectobacterium carotovorum]